MQAFYWAILAALVWGTAPLLEKMGLMKIDVLPGLFWRIFGVLIGLALLLVFKFSVVKEALSAKPQTIVLIVLGGFLASFVGQIFFYKALKLGELSRVVPLAATYPVVTFILGILFLSEKITLTKLSGVALVISGILLLK
ncbi:MAG: EamA family transporter [Candidatus Omnitrophota bacterium]